MATFKIKKAGTSKDGSFWTMIQNEIDGIICRAFVTTSKLRKEGDDLVIPKQLEDAVNWTV